MVRDGVHYTTPQCESFCSNNYNNLTPWSLKCKWEGNWCSSCSKCRELGIQPSKPVPLNMQLLCNSSAEQLDQRAIAVALKELSVDDIVTSFDLLEPHCRKQMERSLFIRCPHFFSNALFPENVCLSELILLTRFHTQQLEFLEDLEIDCAAGTLYFGIVCNPA